MLRVYRSLLYLYPADYRREFGDEMQCVFQQAEADRAQLSPLSRTALHVREVSGLLSGAVQGHLRSLFGFYELLPFRRFNMQPQFRFPRSTVVLMGVILAGVVLAIEKARIVVQMKGGLPRGGAAVWDPMLWSLLSALAAVCVAVAAVWGVLFALRRSGMHRLDSIQPWPERH
jgi:hypothetical protein